jgi:hypothetical protein
MKPLKKRTFRRTKKGAVSDDSVAIGLANLLGIPEAQADQFVDRLEPWRKQKLGEILEALHWQNDPDLKKEDQ